MVPALFSSLFLPVAILFLKSHSNSTETHRVPDERVLGRAVKLQALFQNVYTAVSSLSLGAVFPFYFIFLSFFSYSFCYFSERAANAGQRYFEAPVGCHANSESKSTWPTAATSWSIDGKSRLQIEHKGA